jgi:TonB-linked SusC/RagA family outer membrane protein
MAIAQDVQVTGKVTSAEDGSILPGVSVYIKGTTTGTTTDINGAYSLETPADATLVFSFIGMKTVEIAVGGQTTIDASMDVETTAMEEIVVVAYGKTSKEALTGSVGIVNSDKLEQVPLSSIDKILQGNTPGMFSTSASGQPGSGSDVRIRGIGSISGGNSPLYVVDGIPISSATLSRSHNTATKTSQTEHSLSSALSSLNPNDIESVTILKDAVATSLYGTRASNGVVLITTKKGKTGKTQFEAHAQYGLSTLATNNMRMLNSSEYVELLREGKYNFYLDQGRSPLEAMSLATREAGVDSINTDWLGLAFKNNAPTQSYEVSARGGTEKTTFYVSGSYFDQTGIALDSYFKRMSGRINLDHQANDNMKFGVNLQTSYQNQNTPLTSSAYFISPVVGSYLYRPTVPAYNPDGTPYFDLGGPAGGASFIGVSEYNELYGNTLKMLGNFYAEISFLKKFKYKITSGGDYTNIMEYQWDDPRNPGNTAEDKGRATRQLTSNFIGTLTNLLSYNTIVADEHNIDVMLGHEAQMGKYEALDVATLNFPHPNLRELGSGSENEDSWGTSNDYSLLSYFSRVEYNYDSRYYFFSSFRYDGSSRFGENERFAPFYSVGASWRISRESFMSGIGAINNLKLRASYGTSGNQEIFTSGGTPTYYAYQGLYGYGFNYNGLPGSTPSQIANPDLKWEQNTNTNVGIDFGIINRLTGQIDLYYRKTTDLLLYVPISRTSGFNSALRNVGAMENKGIEFMLTANVIQSTFNWDVDFNLSANRNKVLTLNNGEDIIDDTKIRREGEAYQSFYMAEWAGVNPATGTPMWFDKDGNIVEKYTQADKEIVGTADPKFFGGITNAFDYKGITLSFMFYYQYGNKIYNSVSRITESDGAFSGWNQDAKQLDRWQKPGDYAPNPRRVDGNPTSSNAMSTRWLEDGSFLRLRNATLAYKFPSQIIEKAKLGSLRIYVQGTNLWTLTNYTGLDPEVDLNGTSWFVYPNSRTITFGIDLGF